jgi:hypothetical protein
LGAVAGEIAYAIVLILAWCLFFARPVHLSFLRNGFLRTQGLGPGVESLLAGLYCDCGPA